MRLEARDKKARFLVRVSERQEHDSCNIQIHVVN